MKADIKNRQDIDRMLRRFYDKVLPDPVIGFIFTRIVNIDWEHHIPVIVDFWESILLDNPVYKKNAMEIHYDLNKKFPLQKIHFDTWLFLFTSTVDEMFEGKIATMAKARARSIAGLMQYKMTGISNKSSPL